MDNGIQHVIVKRCCILLCNWQVNKLLGQRSRLFCLFVQVLRRLLSAVHPKALCSLKDKFAYELEFTRSIVRTADRTEGPSIIKV